MTWCEFCRDQYDTDHFDEHGDHRVGPEYGPMGRLMACEVVLRELLLVAEEMYDSIQVEFGTGEAGPDPIIERAHAALEGRLIDNHDQS